MKKDKSQLQGYTLILLAGCLWGTSGLFVTLLSNLGATSYLSGFSRIFFGTLFLIPVVLLLYGKGGFKIDRYGFIFSMVMGVLCQALFNITYNLSITSIGVSTASVLLYTAPIFVCIMSRIVFSELLTKVKVFALILNIIGCILTVTNGDFSTIKFSVFGVLMGICAGFSYGLMTVMSKYISNKGYNTLTVTFYSFAAGALVISLFAKPLTTAASLISPLFLLLVVGFGLVPAAGAYFLYMKGLSKPVETTKVPVIASTEAIVGAIIGVCVFGEAFGFFKLIGIACVFGSIIIMSNAKNVSKVK